MSAYVVWIDQEHAKLFKFMIGGKTENQIVKRHGIEHHTPKHENHQKEHDAFYHDVANHLKDASELLLVGPGLGKEHFKTHLEKHHHSDLLKKIVGSVSMDHPTDPQIVAEARKFFHTKDLFNGIF
jgi:stalled ribosome rescue protein Dom34